jgi:hypothetical protein
MAISENSIVPKRHELIHTFLKDIQDIALKRKKNSIKGVERGAA